MPDFYMVGYQLVWPDLTDCLDWFQDAYGNPTGQELDGMVIISIKNSSGDKNLLFEGRTSRQRFKLIEGKVHIPVSNHFFIGQADLFWHLQ